MSPEQYLTQWQKSQSDAETMSLMIGKLYREKGVEIQVYGRAVINASTIDLIKSHRVARWYTGQEVSTSQTLLILEALSTMALSPCRIDIGRLASQYWQAHDDTEQLDDFLQTAIADLPPATSLKKPRDIVLYGFGRIGRLVTRLMIEKAGRVIPCVSARLLYVAAKMAILKSAPACCAVILSMGHSMAQFWWTTAAMH